MQARVVVDSAVAVRATVEPPRHHSHAPQHALSGSPESDTDIARYLPAQAKNIGVFSVCLICQSQAYQERYSDTVFEGFATERANPSSLRENHAKTESFVSPPQARHG